MSRNLDFYYNLPYSRRFEWVLDKGKSPFWLAWIEELPGCKVEGRTQAEAAANLDEMFAEYIQAKIDWGSPIPTPTRNRMKAKQKKASEVGPPPEFVKKRSPVGVYQPSVPLTTSRDRGLVPA